MSKRNNAYLRAQHMPLLLEFLDNEGLRYKWVAGDWHLRIENVFDVFPTSQKWHYIPDDIRGKYTDYESLQKHFMERYYKWPQLNLRSTWKLP